MAGDMALSPAGFEAAVDPLRAIAHRTGNTDTLSLLAAAAVAQV